jgi:transcriptional regulator with XRE-family HTH domain
MGMTQSDLSDKSGIALRTVQRIEKNEVTPSIHSLNVLGQALNVNLNDAAFRGDERNLEFNTVASNSNRMLESGKESFMNNWKNLAWLSCIVLFGMLFSINRFHSHNVLDDSRASVSTVNCGSQNECDIELINKDANGKTIWRRVIGGSSYDKAGQVMKTNDGGYLVVGSTSSSGNGNYDVLLVKVGPSGDIIWQKTYGEFFNDYGLNITSIEDNLYLVDATRQICQTMNVSNECKDQQWSFKVDPFGNTK